MAAMPAQALTVVATFNEFVPARQTIQRVITGGPTADQDITLAIGRLSLTRTGGTSTLDFLGDTMPGDFLAYCIEPQQSMTRGLSVTYKVVPLRDAANNIGGIGVDKTLLVQELFGRFSPRGQITALSEVTAAALQVAMWEIVREGSSNPFDLGSGNIQFVQSSNEVVFNQAALFLGALDGTGPRATSLRVLQNGAMGMVNDGTQDIIGFVPAPETWAMLIAGFGLVGATMRRRRSNFALVEQRIA